MTARKAAGRKKAAPKTGKTTAAVKGAPMPSPKLPAPRSDLGIGSLPTVRRRTRGADSRPRRTT